MLVHIRSLAVSAAVLCFFAIGIVGSLSGLSPYPCCKRAVLGAVGAYLAAGAAGRIVWAVLTQAMIAGQINKDKDNAGDGQGQEQP
jgi:hypothetical protein